MKVIGYVRVSTSKQGESGLSLEAQEQKVRQYCELYDLDLVAVIVDAGESAKTLNRQGIQQAIHMLKSGTVSGLVVSKLDRLTRCIADLNYLLEDLFTTSSLFSVGDQVDTRSPSGRLVLNLLMSVSQWEREAISQRVKVAMKVMKDKGRYTGGKSPLGWTLDELGNEIPCLKEQELIRLVRDYRVRGFSYQAIADDLTESHFTTRTGSLKFSKSAVKRINDAETPTERNERINAKTTA